MCCLPGSKPSVDQGSYGNRQLIRTTLSLSHQGQDEGSGLLPPWHYLVLRIICADHKHSSGDCTIAHTRVHGYTGAVQIINTPVGTALVTNTSVATRTAVQIIHTPVGTVLFTHTRVATQELQLLFASLLAHILLCHLSSLRGINPMTVTTDISLGRLG